MTGFHVEVQDDAGAGAAAANLVRTAAVATLRHVDVAAPVELTIMLADDDVLQRLNRDFLGHDRPTDVLSFPAGEAGPAGVPGYLGDIAISLPRAAAQAAAAGHPREAELQLLTVHGVLHLLGHDHAAPDEKAAMWAAQAAILTALDAAIVAPADENMQ